MKTFNNNGEVLRGLRGVGQFSLAEVGQFWLALKLLVAVILAGRELSYADAVLVRASDGTTPRCISVANDTIYLKMTRLIVKKESGWLTKDNAIDFLLDTKITGRSGPADQQVDFPSMIEVPVAGYSAGEHGVAVEEPIFTRFDLTKGSDAFNSAEVSFKVLRKKEKKPFGAGLAALLEVTKNMTIPSSVFSPAFKYFSDYASSVVNKSLTEDPNIAATDDTGKLAFTFSPDGSCTGTFEFAGTKAIIITNNGDDYKRYQSGRCYTVSHDPTFNLLYSDKQSDDDNCSKSPGRHFHPVEDAYIAFALDVAAETPAVGTQKVQRKEVRPAKKPKAIKTSKKQVQATLKAIWPVWVASHQVEADALAMDVKNMLLEPDRPGVEMVGTVSTMGGPETHFKPAIQVWTTTQSSATAYDVVDALRRCHENGVSLDACFPEPSRHEAAIIP